MCHCITLMYKVATNLDYESAPDSAYTSGSIFIALGALTSLLLASPTLLRVYSDSVLRDHSC